MLQNIKTKYHLIWEPKTTLQHIINNTSEVLIDLHAFCFISSVFPAQPGCCFKFKSKFRNIYHTLPAKCVFKMLSGEFHPESHPASDLDPEGNVIDPEKNLRPSG